ncbi:nuclease-related domain-containing protein [Pseudalkalibacillus caeni]|uniref:NERD domain-containing protein n=1 Tax=Exobacillus caeni TaxID=2574798 RepID=A0A5R9EVT0_9BACL|nr:nuclease-related domain-containing protein [Pseudalkalibacillus caeni]TLS35332.1 NERD domain-containing protein [Pseudalkalibacillus caeni]
MIVKEREFPLSILKLQALLRRLPPDHPKIPSIKEELKKRTAGFKGETSLDFPLGLLDQQKYFILHDIRLPYKEHFFQIDTLVITCNFIVLIEVKNIIGTIYFDPIFNQLIRRYEDKETAFPDPILQIKRQEGHLKGWLKKNRFEEIPIYSLVAISNPQTIIRTTNENHTLNQKVLHKEALPVKVKQIESIAKEKVLSEKELKKIIRLLKKQHTPPGFPILDQYDIKKNEILKGVICCSCNCYTYKRQHGYWFCSKCQHRSKDAHFQALKDYELLISPTITNNQLRDFLKIESSAVATRLFHSMNLPYSGSNKGRVYHLNLE